MNATETLDLQKRVDRLETAISLLADALLRHNGESDGNWGYPSFSEEMQMLRDTIQTNPEGFKTWPTPPRKSKS